MAYGSRIGRAVLELSIDGGAFVRGAGDAKATMRDLARGIAETQRDIQKQAFTFGGRQQIAEAAKMVEAVQRVGGVTRLVAADQAKVNAAVRQGIEYYRVLGREAPKAWLEIEKATRRADQAQQQSSKNTTGMLAAMRGQMRGLNIGGAAIGAGIGGAIGGFAGTAAVSAVQGITAGISDAVSKGPQLVAVAQSFDRLTASVGETSSAMLMALRPATKGLVADLDLMLATNKAVLLGLPVTRQEMSTLARTAITLGKAMGLDATTGLDNLITALGRSSPLLLDNLGLVVDVEAANQQYAASLDKTSTELTDAERKQAFYNAAMEAARKKTAEIGDVTLTAADNWNRLKVALGNATTAASGAANQNSLLTRSVGALADAAERAAENMDLVAEAEARLEKQGKNGFFRSLTRGLGFADDDIVNEVNKILLERAGTPANPLRGPAGLPPIPKDLVDKDGKLTTGAQQLVDSVRMYSVELKVAEAEAKKLTAAQRAEIAAARELDASNEALVTRLKQFGVSAGQAENVLRVLSRSTKETKKDTDDWQQMLDRFNGSQQRTLSANLARAIGSGQLNLAQMTKEAQDAIRKALEDGADAWRAYGGIVPLELDRAIKAVNKFKTSTLTIINDLQPNLTQAPSIDDVGRQLEEFEAPVKIQETAARDRAKRMRDLDLQASEFTIRQAERAGAKRAQILVMESMLEQRRRDAAIADADEAFQRDVAQLEKTSATYEAEYAKREQEFQDHVEQINQTWAQGEIERREMIRRESSFWASELGKRISGELRGIQHELTGRLVSTLFAGGDEEAKKRAKAAREDYERLKASGRASAEEITRAFRAMREAEEAANTKWSDRFKAMWDGIKRHLFNIFDSILEAFVNNLLKGMLSALAGSALGKAFLGWVGGLGGGAVGRILGIGSSAAAATAAGAGAAALPGAAAAPSVAALLGAPPAAAAGTAAAGAGGAAAAGAGAAGGGGFLGGLAAAGPWAALAAPLLVAWASGFWDKSDGQRILTARRLMQSGGQPSPLRGPRASLLPGWITEDESTRRRIDEGRLFDPVNFGVFGRNVRLGEGLRPRPLSTEALDRALALPVYNSPAEMATASLQRMTGATPAMPAAPRHTTITFNVNTLDADSFDKVIRGKVVPQLRFVINSGQDGLTDTIKKKVLE